MSIQRIFSLFICVLAVFGIVGSLKLPMFNPDGIVYEGFLPLIYSIALLIAGIALFFIDKNKEKVDFRGWLTEGSKNKAFVFFLCNVLLVILVYLFGVLIAMLAYSVVSCMFIKRQTWKGIILFSVFYVAAIYLVFVILLKMPFDRGIIFDKIAGY
jgi:hypothetical protein